MNEDDDIENNILKIFDESESIENIIYFTIKYLDKNLL